MIRSPNLKAVLNVSSDSARWIIANQTNLCLSQGYVTKAKSVCKGIVAADSMFEIGLIGAQHVNNAISIIRV